MQVQVSQTVSGRSPRGWVALAVWLTGAAALVLLDSSIDLANQAVILVLVSALAALWSSPWAAAAASGLGVLAFNVAFVPPRGTFAVDLHQHALLLATTLVVSGLVALLMSRQRSLAAQEQRHAQQSEALRLLGDRLREADDPVVLVGAFRQTLQQATGAAVVLLLPGRAADAGLAEHLEGEADADERAGLHLCIREGVAFGPGTGRHDEQPAWYLPIRGRKASLGAALVRVGPIAATVGQRGHAQALCDQLGLALERADALRSAAAARTEKPEKQMNAGTPATAPAEQSVAAPAPATDATLGQVLRLRRAGNAAQEPPGQAMANESRQ